MCILSGSNIKMDKKNKVAVERNIEVANTITKPQALNYYIHSRI